MLVANEFISNAVFAASGMWLMWIVDKFSLINCCLSACSSCRASMNNVKMSVCVLFVIMFVCVYSFAHQPNVTDPSRPPPPWVLQVSYITLLQSMSCVPSCRLLDIYSCLLMSIGCKYIL